MASKKKLFLKQFGEHVKKIRVRKNLTQFDVACSVNKDRQSIQRLESGNINPTIFYLYELAEGLGIDFNSITNFEFNSPKSKSK